jgi:membrane-associated phospholipid phosphatase
VPGALGWGYATALGVALVYLGEHYLVDLIAGAVFAEAISAAAPRAAPVAKRLISALDALQAQAVG